MDVIRSTLNTHWAKCGAAHIDSDPLAALKMEIRLHQISAAAFEAPGESSRKRPRVTGWLNAS